MKKARDMGTNKGHLHKSFTVMREIDEACFRNRKILKNLPGCIELDKSESFTDASCEGVSLQLKDGSL